MEQHTKEEEKHTAEDLANFIERWLGNPVSRSTLKLLTKRCPKDGRRAERILELYTKNESDHHLCVGCKVSGFLVKKGLDAIVSRSEIEEETIRGHLSDSLWRKGLASVLEGIAEYGARKPFIAYAPFLVVWNITKACNLRCKHCYETAAKIAPDELTTEEALLAVDKMAEAGVAYIAISGGEPLVRKDLYEVAERIRLHGMAFSIATNATLLTREHAKKLKELNCMFVQVSLDGATARSHNWFRGRNSFQQTIKGIKNAVKEGLYVGISTTVTQHNYKEVPKIIELAEKVGAKLFMYYNFIPTGRGEDIVNLELTPDQREELLKMLAEQAGKRKIKLLSTAPQYGRVCIEGDSAILAMTHFGFSGPEDKGNIRFLADFIGGCGAARLYAALEPNGDIEPCVFMPIKLGNIKNDDFLEVWHNSEVLNKMRNREEFSGHCAGCDYRNLCGGCRARAYAYFNDVQGPDPGCIHNRQFFEKVKEDVIESANKS